MQQIHHLSVISPKLDTGDWKNKVFHTKEQIGVARYS